MAQGSHRATQATETPGLATLNLRDLVAPSFFQPHPSLGPLRPLQPQPSCGTPRPLDALVQGQEPNTARIGIPVKNKGSLGILNAFLALQEGQLQSQSSPQTRSHSQEYSQGAAGKGETESVCIAIPSVPRIGLNTTSAVVVELLKALQARSTSSSPSPSSHALGLSFRVLVYSAACSSSSDSSPPPEFQGGVQPREPEPPLRLPQPSPQPGSDGPTEEGLSEHEDGIRAALESLNQTTPGLAGEAEAGIRTGTGTGTGARGGAGLQGALLRADPSLCNLMAHPQLLLTAKPPRHPPGHWLWRTKETIDFLYVMRQCLALGPDFVLFLEEDTWPVHAWDLGIQRALDAVRRRHTRFALSLYYPSSNGWYHRHLGPYPFPCCTQAVFLPAGVAKELLRYAEERFAAKPVDWLIRSFMDGHNVSGVVHRPSLFQHSSRVLSSNRWRKRLRGHEDHEFDPDWVRKAYTPRAPS